jgi:hypothetical protein
MTQKTMKIDIKLMKNLIAKMGREFMNKLGSDNFNNLRSNRSTFNSSRLNLSDGMFYNLLINFNANRF